MAWATLLRELTGAHPRPAHLLGGAPGAAVDLGRAPGAGVDLASAGFQGMAGIGVTAL